MKNTLLIAVIFCLSSAPVFAQDNLKVKIKDPKPDIYIDGKKYDHDILEFLDQNKIESVNVIKDEKALKKYNAPNGVILITTKKASEQISNDIEKEVFTTEDNKNPIFIIDGKVSTKETLSKLSPDDIEKIEVVKGQKAIDDYAAPNGVIIVKTKKD